MTQVRGLETVSVAKTLDLRGEVCPTPTDETMKVLDSMADGEVLEVLSDYYPAKTTIPWHCERRGYPYQFFDEGKPIWRIRIQKKEV